MNKGLGLALASVAMMGMNPAPLQSQPKATVQETRIETRKKVKKRKGNFPTSGGTYINQGKYTGAKLRKIRKKQAATAWANHLRICKEQGVESDIKEHQLVDLW